MGDNVWIHAPMEFDLIYVHFQHMPDFNVQSNSKSIDSAISPPTFSHSLLNEQFPTS